LLVGFAEFLGAEFYVRVLDLNQIQSCLPGLIVARLLALFDAGATAHSGRHDLFVPERR
jgi:hypothetical protein